MKKNNIITDLENYLYKYNQIQQLLNEVTHFSNCYIIGGALRKYKRYNTFNGIRDIDIVCKPLQGNSLDSLCSKYHCKINKFNGYKVIDNDISLDIWELDNTWAIREGYITYTKNDNIPKILQKTVFLNLDTIVYDINNNVLYDDIYNEALHNNIIDIILEANPELRLNIARAFVIKHEYNMQFSDKLKQVIYREYIQNKEEFIHDILSIQKHRYNKILLNKHEITRKCNSIDAYFNT